MADQGVESIKPRNAFLEKGGRGIGFSGSYRQFNVAGDNLGDGYAILSMLNIGQDGTGTYKHRLPAQLDEFILTADVLTEADIAALKAYYR